ncbi:hypothetical protein M378DRAFT_165235, partial [Amanita muscaria Koide BX008]
SEPYDPYLPRAGSATNPAGPSQPNPKTAAIQAQIDDTVGIMRENITKVAKRGEALDALQDKTDNLAVSAQGFRRGANRVRKIVSLFASMQQSEYVVSLLFLRSLNFYRIFCIRWKDMKMRIIIGVAVSVIIVIIVVSIVKATQHK